ncbi:iron chaperone [Intrasporangium mesophilum]
MTPRFESVDDYIDSYPEETRAQLAQVRTAIQETAPQAHEKISYGMATFTMDGRPLVYFAGWKNHIGLYPVPTGDPAFEAAIGPYRRAKDTVRFPTSRPVPLDLVAQITELCLRRHAERESEKS